MLANNENYIDEEIIIKFIFPTLGYDEYLTFNYNQIFNECPIVANQCKEIKFEMPDWINPNELMEYFYISKNGLDNNVNKLNTQMIKIINISEYLENYLFTSYYIKGYLLKNLDKNNCFSIIEVSYQKLSSSSENSADADPVWFELFYAVLEYIAKNIFYFLNNNFEKLEKIRNLNKKIMEEIIEKAFSYLILNNSSLNEEENLNTERTSDRKDYLNTSENDHNSIPCAKLNIEDYEKLIFYICKIRNSKNIFELLINEYLILSSEQSINELENMPNPTFQISIPIDLNNYYNEFPIELGMGKVITFIIFYKKSDDSLNVSFKLTNSITNDLDKLCFNIFTFLCIVMMDDDKVNNQVNVKSVVSNNKSNYPIYKLNNLKKHISLNSSECNTTKNKINRANSINEQSDIYEFEGVLQNNIKKECFYGYNELNNNLNSKNYLNNVNSLNNHNDYFSYVSNNSNVFKKDTFNLKINLRICFLHTAIGSFILKQFKKFYHLPNINKLSTQFFQIFIKHKFLKKENEDQVVIALLNWLSDEININQDITDIIENINWKNVSTELILEFIIKHQNMIETYELDKFFEQKILLKLEEQFGQNNNSSLNGTNTNGSNLTDGITKLLFSNLLKASKNISYKSLLIENKKMSKINLIHFQNSLNKNKTRSVSCEESLTNSIANINIKNNSSNVSWNQDNNKNFNLNSKDLNNFNKGNDSRNTSNQSKNSSYNYYTNLNKSKNNNLNNNLSLSCSNGFANIKTHSTLNNENPKSSSIMAINTKKSTKKIEKTNNYLTNSNKESVLNTSTNKIIKKMSHILPTQPSLLHPSTTKNDVKTKSISGNKNIFLELHKDIYKLTDSKKAPLNFKKNYVNHRSSKSGEKNGLLTSVNTPINKLNFLSFESKSQIINKKN